MKKAITRSMFSSPSKMGGINLQMNGVKGMTIKIPATLDIQF
jgi:hypothetical protein